MPEYYVTFREALNTHQRRSFPLSAVTYQYAKLRMLQFYYDFIDTSIERPRFQYCEMDTDSAYIALAGESVDDLVSPFMREYFFRINQANGSNVDTAAEVGPVNNSLFSQVDVSLNGTLVTPSTNTYPYCAYIEILLCLGAEAKNSQLTCVLWYKDTADHMDATDTANEGLQKRQDYTVGSRVVDMMGRLHVDLFFQDRYLLNGVDIKVRLVQSKDTFALMARGSSPAYKITIVEAALFARKAKLNPSVQMGHIKALDRGTANTRCVGLIARYFSYRERPCHTPMKIST